MARKQRGSFASVDSCAVCGLRDARGLLQIELACGARATLCGSHELMHRRDGRTAESEAELRARFAERRSTERRAEGGADELAERLASAFTPERRVTERRA
jgi:hypothetical protein